MSLTRRSIFGAIAAAVLFPRELLRRAAHHPLLPPTVGNHFDCVIYDDLVSNELFTGELGEYRDLYLSDTKFVGLDRPTRRPDHLPRQDRTAFPQSISAESNPSGGLIGGKSPVYPEDLP